MRPRKTDGFPERRAHGLRARNREMYERWQRGESLGAIASDHGVSYQRVQQIVRYVARELALPVRRGKSGPSTERR